MYCILAQLTNGNVLGKSGGFGTGGFGRNTVHAHVTVKDHIYEYTLTNTDNELYCNSNESHSHLPFDRPCVNQHNICKNAVILFIWCRNQH